MRNEEMRRKNVIGHCTTKENNNILNSHIKQDIMHLLLYMILE